MCIDYYFLSVIGPTVVLVVCDYCKIHSCLLPLPKENRRKGIKYTYSDEIKIVN